ncbi:MAG: alanine racemase [Verrucomicrobiota bacterium]|nr:alanine racemase [Verrucomicrobiota bacterium]
MILPHRCWAEIDLIALRNNLAWLRHRIGSENQILTVVKADAYGHGLKQIAAFLMQSGTNIFGVANINEAQDIRAVGRGWPILMLGACLPDEIEHAIKDKVMPTISSQAEAIKFSRIAKKMNKNVRAHLKIDTGMGRLGCSPDKAGELAGLIKHLPNLSLEGIYTHYASAEDKITFSSRQRTIFAKTLKSIDHKFEFTHANNSAALLHEPKSIYNLARPGLLVYGVMPPGKRTPPELIRKHLQPALSWKCRVTFVKNITKGTPLSYGQKYVSRKKMRVATLSAGYGDGYLASTSGQAKVIIGGKLCSILGRITMDQMLADVSRLPSIKTGDEAILIGPQHNQCITANQVAQWAGTVPWETLAAITHRVPRLYRGTQAA